MNPANSQFSKMQHVQHQCPSGLGQILILTKLCSDPQYCFPAYLCQASKWQINVGTVTWVFFVVNLVRVLNYLVLLAREILKEFSLHLTYPVSLSCHLGYSITCKMWFPQLLALLYVSFASGGM